MVCGPEMIEIRTYLKIFGTLPVVIPAQAGIHVFQGNKWTPAFARVTDSSRTYLFCVSFRYFS